MTWRHKDQQSLKSVPMKTLQVYVILLPQKLKMLCSLIYAKLNQDQETDVEIKHDACPKVVSDYPEQVYGLEGAGSRYF